ncbi:MAG TPA: 4'-phosphopantetheinyl transferase superfamily protein [Solirubrobacteraceae bacterium]|nr:4'-phosphopantetheinyl transferase superfamily protein [Solirubrobacteraceae bacterium]
MSARTPARATTVAGASAGWTTGPAAPVLTDATVDVWRVDLADDVGDDVVALLSADERTRAAAIASERPRLLWSRSRGVLRQLLARYLRQDARAIELDTGAHGKPRLAGAGAAIGVGKGGDTGRGEKDGAALHFNLSHSRHLALYAFAAAGPVGVDVELARERGAPVRDYVALARRAFGERPAQRLVELDGDSREREFLRLWTRYEAERKRIGIGIDAADRPPDGDLQIGERDAATSSLVELDVAPGAAAALALGWRASELRRWDWT